MPLHKLVRLEPDWAVSMILHRDKLEHELAEAKAELSRVQNNLRKYGGHLEFCDLRQPYRAHYTENTCTCGLRIALDTP